jgi:hypothetical protein
VKHKFIQFSVPIDTHKQNLKDQWRDKLIRKRTGFGNRNIIKASSNYFGVTTLEEKMHHRLGLPFA